MKTYLILLLSLFTSGQLLHAQFRGKIIELSQSGDSTALPGVTVRTDSATKFAITDANGDFVLKGIKVGTRIHLSAMGYEERSVVVKDTTQFALLILKSGVELNEIDIVYYSNGTEISYLNPIKVETLGERSLMKAACCNLSESFETNPSIDVSFSDAISGAKQIQMLGLSGQYAQITKENMPYLRGLAANYGLTFIPGSWIQSIQLSKGAGSVVNGYESFTGQINTELQNPAKSDRLNFNAYVNQNARNEYNLNLRTKLNSNWSTGLLTHYSNNPLAQDMNGDGFVDIPTGSQINVMNKWSYQHPKSGFEAQFGGAYLKDNRVGGQGGDMMAAMQKDSAVYGITINNEKAEAYSKTGIVFKRKPGHSAGLQLSFLDHNQQTMLGSNMYTGREQTAYANLIYQGIIKTTNHTYKFGSSAMYDNVNENWMMQNYARTEKVVGVFAEYAYNFKEKFNMIAGLRSDYHNYYGLFFTPRLHLRYAFRPSSVLRFSAGKALRTANIFTDNAGLMASSRMWMIHGTNNILPYGLKPEIGYNYGLNYTYKFQVNYREAYITIDAYRTDFVQQVVVDLDADAQMVHISNLNGKSFSNTLQFEFNAEPRKRLFLKAAYRYVDAKQTYHDTLLERPYVSKHRGFVNLSYETKNGHWQFDATAQYNGIKRLPSTKSNPTEYQREDYSPDYFNVLSQITYIKKIKGHFFNAYVGVENLLNYKQKNPIVDSDAPYSRYFDASMVWGPIYGRMLYAGIRYRIKE